MKIVLTIILNYYILLKAEKIGLEKHFSCYLQFCVFFLYLKFGGMNFFTDRHKEGHKYA